jgi:hypothetical protein
MPPLKFSTDLGFLSEDLKRQQEIAQEALDEAKRLDTLVNDPQVAPEVRQELERAKITFVRIARELAANTATTSSSAITVIGSTKK